MQHYTPAAPAVRQTLERLLGSETFGRSERARKLLCYLVEREQAGEADRLKGFAIAMDVFGRDSDFDPSTDAVVRVQAGRLRDLLQQYFATEGVGDAVRISIPRGSYVPTYEANAIRLPDPLRAGPDPALAVALSETLSQIDLHASQGLTRQTVATAPEPTAIPAPDVYHSPLMRQLRFFWVAIALVVAMLGVLLMRQGNSISDGNGGVTTSAATEADTQTGSVAAVPSNETLPVVYISVKNTSPESGRVATALRAGLSGFDTINFIGRDMPAARSPDTDAISFVFELLPGATASDVTLEVQNVATGRVLLSRNLTATDTAPSMIEDHIAGILSATVPATGAIYSYIQQNGLQAGLTACLLLNDDYYLDQNAKTHEAAYRCLETLVLHDAKTPLAYSELAALHLEAVTDHYSYPPGATAEQALELAHRGVLLGATSPYAHRAYGFINSRIGNHEESIRWMRKAYELNTYDLSMAAAYGYAMIFAGRYGEGTPIIARAVEASSAHPNWWDYGLFLGEFMLGDMQKAARATGPLTPTAKKSHYLAARIITAKATGNDQLAKELLAELTTEFPKFAADPRATFVGRRYPADLVDRLVEALNEAGLGGGS